MCPLSWICISQADTYLYLLTRSSNCLSQCQTWQMLNLHLNSRDLSLQVPWSFSRSKWSSNYFLLLGMGLAPNLKQAPPQCSSTFVDCFVLSPQLDSAHYICQLLSLSRHTKSETQFVGNEPYEPRPWSFFCREYWNLPSKLRKIDPCCYRPRLAWSIRQPQLHQMLLCISNYRKLQIHPSPIIICTRMVRDMIYSKDLSYRNQTVSTVCTMGLYSVCI